MSLMMGKHNNKKFATLIIQKAALFFSLNLVDNIRDGCGQSNVLMADDVSGERKLIFADNFPRQKYNLNYFLTSKLHLHFFHFSL